MAVNRSLCTSTPRPCPTSTLSISAEAMCAQMSKLVAASDATLNGSGLAFRFGDSRCGNAKLRATLPPARQRLRPVRKSQPQWQLGLQAQFFPFEIPGLRRPQRPTLRPAPDASGSAPTSVIATGAVSIAVAFRDIASTPAPAAGHLSPCSPNYPSPSPPPSCLLCLAPAFRSPFVLCYPPAAPAATLSKALPFSPAVLCERAFHCGVARMGPADLIVAGCADSSVFEDPKGQASFI